MTLLWQLPYITKVRVGKFSFQAIITFSSASLLLLIDDAQICCLHIRIGLASIFPTFQIKFTEAVLFRVSVQPICYVITA